MAEQNQDTSIHFSVGPFEMEHPIPTSRFQSLDPSPWFLHLNDSVRFPQLHGQLWRMFAAWAFSRDYDIPEPGKTHPLLVQAVGIVG